MCAQAVVYLRILSSARMLLVHIGENESNALLKEINKQRQMRPLTHDVMRNILKEINFRVIKIRITDIVANTYYARIHLARLNGAGQVEPDSEVDVDARPSDAINLAVRFGAPMYVNKRIAEVASTLLQEPVPQSESSAEIVRSVRDTLASFEDPTGEWPRAHGASSTGRTSAGATWPPALLGMCVCAKGRGVAHIGLRTESVHTQCSKLDHCRAG